MNSFLRLASLVIVGLLASYFYYIFYSWHGEDKSFFYIFLGISALVYLCYKAVFLILPKVKSELHSLHILSFFLVELFLVCLCFFGFQEQNIGGGIIVFVKLCFILGLISLFWILFYSIGRTILEALKLFHHDEIQARFLASLGLGFSLYILGVFFLAFFGLYTLPAVGVFTLICAGASYKSFLAVFSELKTPLISYHHNIDVQASFTQRLNVGRVIDELHFGVISFLLSVNFLNVYRPFPIGWDDLGVYMNYPRLLAQSGELLALGKMYFWEIYTGLGFLTGSQMSAFFLNSFSGVILAVVVYISLNMLLPEKKTVFNIPLFCVMIVLCMPMTVFQLAKDMKLDYGLLSISVIALSLLYYVIFSEKQYTQKKYIGLYLLIGFLIGICFSLKVTSLLLLLGAFAVLFYRHFSLFGIFGFFGLFFGAFTYMGLWSMMNISIPKDSSSLTNIFSGVSILAGGGSLVFAYITKKHKRKNIKFLTIEILCLSIGFFGALLPWGIKHITELSSGESISLGYLLGGKAEQYIPAYEKIYTPEQILKIQNAEIGNMSLSGTTSNEDFGRYFGYEGGINNYLKLPWNLTFQVNQKGEFTDITLIFFVLIPLVFLFLPFRKQEYIYPILATEFFLLLYYIPGPISSYITELFSHVPLPFGYIYILLFFIIPFIYLFSTLDRSQKLVKIFLLNFAFSTLYVFLWTISAFGIVWYGILMYFVFLLMIALSLVAAHDSDEDISYIGIYTVLGIVWLYILLSVIPHGITNLRSAGYPEYKLGKQTEEFSLMNFHPDYFPTLFALNVQAEKQSELFISYRNRVLATLDGVPDAENLLTTVQSLQDISQLADLLTQLGQFSISPEIDSQILSLRQELYELVMNTPKDLKNQKNIYRAGTFLKYFISENNERILEDNLLTVFDTYMYDTNPDITLERFKKLDISYILLDLNAATIDQDPAQNLTKRYENMLQFLVHPKLKLVETDSICLKLALDVYKVSADIEKYTELAGVNYGVGDLKQQRQLQCLNIMSQLIVSNQISTTSYPYLLVYQNALPRLGVDPKNLDSVQKGLAPYLQAGYKVLFEILP